MRVWPLEPPVAAAAVMVVAWIMAVVLRWFFRRASRVDWLSRLFTRSGILAGLTEPSLEDLRQFAGRAAYCLTLLAGAAIALAVVNEYAARRLLDLVMVHLPKIVLAIGLLIATRWTSAYASRATLVLAANEGLSYPWRWAAAARAGTLFAGLALTSELTGVATLLVRSAFLIVLAGLVALGVVALAPLLRGHLSRQPAGPRPVRIDESCR